MRTSGSYINTGFIGLPTSLVDDFRHRWRLEISGRLAALRGSARLSVDGVDERLPVIRPEDFLTARSVWKEQPIIDWLREKCRNCAPATVLDVGSGVGSHALAITDVATEIHCVEPHPYRISTLLEAVPSSTTVHAVAAHDKAELLPLSLSDNRIQDTEGIHVQGKPIDSLGIQADIVKIDVEGHEEKVLSGAVKTLSEANAVVVEVHNALDDPVDPTAIERQLVDVGFEVRELLAPDAAQIYLVGE